MHSSILAWRVPWTEEPGGLQSRRSHGVSQGSSNLAHMHAHYSHPDTPRFPGDWPSTGIKYPSPDSKPLKSQCALQQLCIPTVPYNHCCLVMYTLMMT